MTTVSQIIYDAFRQGNLIAVGASPTAGETEEALRYLNRLVKSVFGHEAGDALTDFPIGNDNYVRPSGYPQWQETPDYDWFVPKNTRTVLNLVSNVSLYLHPAPDDGCRFAYANAGRDLSDPFNLTIYGNGHTIDEQINIRPTENSGEWFYRAELADWKKTSPLTEEDEFPFPEEFDDYFISMLALRLNPSYGVQIDGQSQMLMNRSRRQLKARYAQTKPMHSEMALFRLSDMVSDRDQWTMYEDNFTLDPNSLFNRG